MFETVVIATDGSASAKRGVQTALDLAERFDATVHALYVIDADDIESSPDDIRDELEEALVEAGDEALEFVESQAGDSNGEVVTEVRESHPAPEIVDYADEVEADLIAMGTRGRHGDHAFLLGSVAENVVRRSPVPVLTVRQLDDDESA
jgi:nucleotide-binding universal stress UspA family protein